jgi:hypothetical protein
MAATIIENQGTEPFVLPAPFRGIIDPGKRIYLNLSLAVVATALGGSSTYRPTEGAQLKIALLYDASYAGAYDTFNQGNADGSNSVAIPAGQVPYGNPGGTALTSEAALAYNATTNTLSAGSVNATTAFGMGGAAPAVMGAAIADAAGGATVDAEARTALNALLAQMRLFGFIAP